MNFKSFLNILRLFQLAAQLKSCVALFCCLICLKSSQPPGSDSIFFFSQMVSDIHKYIHQSQESNNIGHAMTPIVWLGRRPDGNYCWERSRSQWLGNSLFPSILMNLSFEIITWGRRGWCVCVCVWGGYLCTFVIVNMRMTYYEAQFWQKSVFCQFLLRHSSLHPRQTQWSMRQHAVVCFRASKNIIKTYNCQAGAWQFVLPLPYPFLGFSPLQSGDDAFCCILKCGKTEWRKSLRKNTLDKSNLFCLQ